jgi:hypothetical protein
LRCEDGGSFFLRDGGIQTEDYTDNTPRSDMRAACKILVGNPVDERLIGRLGINGMKVLKLILRLWSELDKIGSYRVHYGTLVNGQ